MMLRDRKQLGAVAAGEQKISALTRTAATLNDLGEAPESHTEQIGRPMARVTEPVSAGLGRSNLSQDSVATVNFRCGGIFNNLFIANVLLNVAVKNF